MDTAYLSAERRDTQNHGQFIHFSSPSPPAPVTCKMAVAGACSVPDLCRHARRSEQQPFPTGAINRRAVRRGQALYRAGDPLVNLYQLYAGSMKLRITNSAGTEQIASFPMAGSLLGLDGIETGHHMCDAVALEDSLVCVLPFSDVLACSRTDTEAALQLNRAIAHETSHYRRLLMVMANMSSEERIANFILTMSERMATNGYSPQEFVLKMTREDIARHLGMKIETVSRALGHLQLAHIVDVSRRRLCIRDPKALSQMGSSR